jgi:hypothetical protein
MHGITTMHPTLLAATDEQLQPLQSDQQQPAQSSGEILLLS